MEIQKTNIVGVDILTPRVFKDNRGTFSEIYNEKFPFDVVQVNHVTNNTKYVFRGFHFQTGKFSQAKVIKCIKGAIIDMALDIRVGSPTYGKIFSIELNSNQEKMLSINSDLAHAYITLVPCTELIYFCSQSYKPEFESGFRVEGMLEKIFDPYNQQIVKVSDVTMSEKDKNWPLFK